MALTEHSSTVVLFILATRPATLLCPVTLISLTYTSLIRVSACEVFARAATLSVPFWLISPCTSFTFSIVAPSNVSNNGIFWPMIWWPFPFNVPLNIPGITAVPDADSDISISVVRTYTPDKSFLIFFRSAADAISFVWSIVVIFESLFLRIGVFPSFRGAKSQTSSLQPMFV